MNELIYTTRSGSRIGSIIKLDGARMTGADWSTMFTAFAGDVGRPGRAANSVTLHTTQCYRGVYWSECVASASGASFSLYVLPGVGADAARACKAFLRRNRDVVSMTTTTIDELIPFYWAQPCRAEKPNLQDAYAAFLTELPVLTHAALLHGDDDVRSFIRAVYKASPASEELGETPAWFLFEELGWPEGANYCYDGAFGITQGSIQFVANQIERKRREPLPINDRLELRRRHWKRPSKSQFVAAHAWLMELLKSETWKNHE